MLTISIFTPEKTIAKQPDHSKNDTRSNTMASHCFVAKIGQIPKNLKGYRIEIRQRCQQKSNRIRHWQFPESLVIFSLHFFEKRLIRQKVSNIKNSMTSFVEKQWKIFLTAFKT